MTFCLPLVEFFPSRNFNYEITQVKSLPDASAGPASLRAGVMFAGGALSLGPARRRRRRPYATSSYGRPAPFLPRPELDLGTLEPLAPGTWPFTAPSQVPCFISIFFFLISPRSGLTPTDRPDPPPPGPRTQDPGPVGRGRRLLVFREFPLSQCDRRSGRLRDSLCGRQPGSVGHLHVFRALRPSSTDLQCYALKNKRYGISF